MKSILNIFLTLTSIAPLFACGMSPQLNHTYPEREPAVRDLQQTTSGCDFLLTKENLCATLTWVAEPNDDAQGEFSLKFWKNDSVSTRNGPFVDPTLGTVAVKLWMPSMGHGSQPVVISRSIDAAGTALTGSYRVSSVYFVMPGAWQILLQLKNGTTVLDQAALNYTAH